MCGRHSHSTLPLGATSAVVLQSDRNAYSAMGGNGLPPRGTSPTIWRISLRDATGPAPRRWTLGADLHRAATTPRPAGTGRGVVLLQASERHGDRAGRGRRERRQARQRREARAVEDAHAGAVAR